MIPDRLIISSTNDHFLDFLPTVSHVWDEMFPGINITLAILNEGDSDSLSRHLSKYADVCVCQCFHDIPKANIAKLARFLAAALYKDDICIIEDIDTIPLQKSYIEKALESYEDGKILMIGQEVYTDSKRYSKLEVGKIPISNMTGKGEIFQKVFNPKNLSYEQLLRSFCEIPKYKDEKEQLSNPPEFFSDESLIRALIHYNNCSDLVKKIDRNIDTNTQCVDREWFMEKDVDYVKLTNGQYLFWNCCRPLFKRPFRTSAPKVLKLMSHIWKKEVKIEDILL